MKRAKRFKMHKYNWELPDGSPKQRFIEIEKIVVKSEWDKEQLLLASEYIHGLRNIDTDYTGANLLAHLYHNPDIIEVIEQTTEKEN